MFNTLVYIPTILAYTFISLLVVILGFIVIYVSHKIYTTIYDNLPVAKISSNSLTSEQMESKEKTSNLLHESHKTRKSKTALRIIVTLEPCYLAYMVFITKFPHTTHLPSQNSTKSYQFSHSSINSSIRESSQEYVSTITDHLLNKYFDSLASIPTIRRDLQKCDNFKMFNNICRRSK